MKELVTSLLRRARQGDLEAASSLMPLVYEELRRGAAERLRAKLARRAVPPSVLIHKAFLRLVNERGTDWHDRAHFFGVASHAMRRVLVDQARARLAGKPWSAETVFDLDGLEVADRPENLQQVILADEALGRLASFDPQQAQVAEMHYFAGMDVEETAAAMGVATRAAARDWSLARDWLRNGLLPQAVLREAEAETEGEAAWREQVGDPRDWHSS